MNCPKCGGKTNTYRHMFARIWCSKCGYCLREEGSPNYNKEVFGMQHDNYDPDSEPLQIRTDLRNLSDGLYLVYSRHWKGGPAVLDFHNGRWFALNGFIVVEDQDANKFDGVIGPIPRMMI